MESHRGGSRRAPPLKPGFSQLHWMQIPLAEGDQPDPLGVGLDGRLLHFGFMYLTRRTYPPLSLSLSTKTHTTNAPVVNSVRMMMMILR